MEVYNILKFFCIIILQNIVFNFPLHEVINKDHTVVVFAFSGLRWDSTQLYKLTALEKLQQDGVTGMRKIDAFQTESLPAFISMITGEYPESHGMLSNKMKDLVTGETFNVKNTNLKWWNNFEPVWVTNKKTGNYSGLCYWPGHEVVFNNKCKVDYHCASSNYTDPFKELITKGDIISKVMSFSDRLKHVKQWLNLKTKRPSFIGVYFEEPFRSMMKYGIRSEKTKAALEGVNNITTEMLDFLTEKNKLHKINFIVTGESGVTELVAHQEIYLQDYTDNDMLDKFDVVDDGPIMTIHPHNHGTMYTLFKQWHGKHKHMAVYNGSNLPKNFHYSHKNRTMPIILVADEHWRIYRKRIVDTKQAMMGFDGQYSSSHSYFVAHGPAFKKDVKLEALSNIDVYGMMCHALKIKPRPNSCNKTTVDRAMRLELKWYHLIIKKVASSTLNLTIAIIVSLLLLFGVVYFIITIIFKSASSCACPEKAMKVKVLSPNKLLKNKKKDGGKQHLLSDEELSSDLSSDDDEGEFHIDNYNKYSNKK